MNAGPARIPGHHHYVLHYCRELGVALEPFINVNQNAWVHDRNINGGRPVRFRHLVTDARGFLAELSSKAIDGAAFDAPLSAEDLERLREFLRAYGDLDEGLRYAGSDRAGLDGPGRLAPTPGIMEQPRLRSPLDFSEILRSDFWRAKMHFGQFLDQAAPLMQPVGGMDRIVAAFRRNIRSPIRTRAQVKSVRLTGDGVSVVYQHRGEHHQLEADYCFNCIPKHLLLGLDNNFPSDDREALGCTGRGKLFKIGFQMAERFWEDEQIYGGISWTDQPIVQIWYPSHGIHQRKGIVLGAYTFFPEQYAFFERLGPEEQCEAALAQGEKIHPDYRRHAECGVAINWHRMNHQLGCAAQWTEENARRHLPRLQAPLAGRHFLLGCQVSQHPGWQEGAFSSAHHALREGRRGARGARGAGPGRPERLVSPAPAAPVRRGRAGGRAGGPGRGEHARRHRGAPRCAGHGRRGGLHQPPSRSDPHREDRPMKHSLFPTLTAGLLLAGAAAAELTRHPLPNSDFPISQAVEVSADTTLVFHSGMTPRPANPEAERFSREFWGDTETQTLSVFSRLEESLQAKGLDFSHVVKMQVFLVGVPELDGAMDFQGMMRAYRRYFGSDEQPQLPARSAFQVAGLAAPGMLVEIEVVLARP